MESVISLAIGLFQSPYGKIILGMGNTTMYVLLAILNISRVILGISVVPRTEVMTQDTQGRWRELLPKQKLGREILYPRAFIASVTVKRWFRSTLVTAVLTSYGLYMLYAFGTHFKTNYDRETTDLNTAIVRSNECIAKNLNWDLCANYSKIVAARKDVFCPNVRLALYAAYKETYWLGFYSFEDVARRVSPIVIHYTASLLSSTLVVACLFVLGLLFVDGLSAKPVDDAAENEKE